MTDTTEKQHNTKSAAPAAQAMPALRERPRARGWWTPSPAPADSIADSRISPSGAGARKPSAEHRKSTAMGLMAVMSMASTSGAIHSIGGGISMNALSSIGSGAVVAVGSSLFADTAQAQTPAPGDPGPKGVTGAPGDPGVQGPAGATGNPGSKGAPGGDGATGPKGGVGDPGDPGNQGQKGDVGDPGVTGPGGGDKGDTGDTGATGAPGTTGATGATGADGADGAKGDFGNTGQKGDPGATGAAGSGGGLELSSDITDITGDTSSAGTALNTMADLLEKGAPSPGPPTIIPLAGPASGGSAPGPSTKQVQEQQANEAATNAAIRDTANVLRRAASAPESPGYRLAEILAGGGSSDARVGATIAGMHENWEEIQTVRVESREGTAVAIALGGLRFPQNKDNAFSMRYGRFEGEEALAAQAGFRVRDNLTVDFGVSHGFEYSQRGYSAGFVLSW